MSLRVLIVEDEPLAVERLQGFLKDEPGIEVSGVSANGEEALRRVRELSPEILILDLKLQGLDGLGVLTALSGKLLPAVILTTAHEEYAVKAFESNAVDYLLKPFHRERFHLAMERARLRVRASSIETSKERSLDASDKSFGTLPRPLERLMIKSEGRISFLKTADIDWVSAADNYVELHSGANTHFMRMTISSLETELSNAGFVRISRSHLVNVDRIKEIRPKQHGDCLVLLNSGKVFSGTRKYRKNLRRYLAPMRP